MRGPARIATYLGRILMLIGFLLILAAWDNAAELDYLQGQFPFLLSASIPGLAMIITGAGLEYVQALRQFSAKRAKQMAVLNASVLRLVEVSRDGSLDARLGAGATAARTPVGAVASSGAGATAVLTGPGEPGGPGTQMVIGGRSSFHSLDCHLVADRDDLPPIPRLRAEAQGLNPCRVCKP